MAELDSTEMLMVISKLFIVITSVCNKVKEKCWIIYQDKYCHIYIFICLELIIQE